MSSFLPGDMVDTAAMDTNFDYMYKILMVGNSGVGKTAFVTQYCDGKFDSAFISTVGIDFRVKTLHRNNKTIKLQVWDTAGQERYQAITTAYYHGAMGFVIMFDLTDEESFHAVRSWATQIRELSLESAVLVLVGNKNDISPRKVSTEQINQLSTQLNIQYFETSAKTNFQVKETIEYIVDQISLKMQDAIDKNPSFVPRGVRPRPTDAPQPTSNSGCAC